ncbi:uncharacterized protein TNCV_2505611 [Trichonephila clavipes]|uniref:Uncharacterized protein n=1 Tax=Trichonephila clavipes TaxID=2585209 RepID=A0A8X6WFZ9_TRICX|nr:uncharacterized protein TNCV_2505611 [Trichonephila clavipes]
MATGSSLTQNYSRSQRKWQKRSDFELNHSNKESDIVNFIKIQRIKWASHVVRMNEDRYIKNVFNAQPTVPRRKGRPNLRWIDGLEKDLLVLKTKNWRTLAGRRLTRGKCFLRRPRPTLGCRAIEEGRREF